MDELTADERTQRLEQLERLGDMLYRALMAVSTEVSVLRGEVGRTMPGVHEKIWMRVQEADEQAGDTILCPSGHTRPSTEEELNASVALHLVGLD